MPRGTQNTVSGGTLHGVAGNRMRFERDQLRVGGRQTAGGSNDAVTNLAVGIRQGEPRIGSCNVSEAVTKTTGTLQLCPVLQSLPVLAAVSASLQQSPSAPDMSIAVGTPCSIGQGCLKTCAFALPCKASAKQSRKVRNARIGRL